MRKLGLLIDQTAMYVAVSDLMNWTAEPVSPIRYDLNDEAPDLIKSLVAQYGVDTIVMGLSTADAELKEHQESFGKALEGVVSANVVFKETDSTTLNENNADVDLSFFAVATTLFLQKYLDDNSSTQVVFKSEV